jgi:CheY-like chemotaxis protein
LGRRVVGSSERLQQTILVVEDEHFIRMDIAAHLRDCGWHVIEAGTAREAIAVLESGVQIDLVFSDIQMPGAMNGLGLADWLRHHRPRVPIILTSGVINASDTTKALCDEGPISKPYDHRHLAERIRHHLGLAPGKPCRDPRSPVRSES